MLKLCIGTWVENPKAISIIIKLCVMGVKRFSVVILRMGHRIPRDARITTHVCLVARAFGADGVIVSDVRDVELEKKISSVVDRWGGSFFIQTGPPWVEVVKEWLKKGEVVHLTQYGIPLPEVIEEVKASGKDKLVVVGSQKQPREVFELANYNVSVTLQPHSEVAALALFLHYLHEGREFYTEFSNAKLKVIPSNRGKKVIKLV